MENSCSTYSASKEVEHDRLKAKNKPKRTPTNDRGKWPSTQTVQKDLSEQTEKSPDKLEHSEKQAFWE
jgi:hypothetical protein